MKRSTILLLLAIFGSCRPVLQGELSESEANEILAVLLEEGVSAEKSGRGEGRFEIKVGKDEFQRAWHILRERGLPRRQHAGLRQAYHERSLVPGRIEEQAVLVAALQEELAETLESVSGVVSARVHLSLPAEKGHSGEPRAPSASVLMVVARRPPPLEEDEVRKLVAHAVDGLEPGRVAVVVLEKEAGQPPVRPSTASKTTLLWPALGCMLIALTGCAWLLLKRRYLSKHSGVRL